MTTYHNPQEVVNVGRELKHVPYPGLSGLIAQLQPGEKLVGVYVRGPWEMLSFPFAKAVELDQTDYYEFEQQYKTGQFIARRYYGVKA